MSKLSGANSGNLRVNGSSQPNVGFCAGTRSSNDNSGTAPPSFGSAPVADRVTSPVEKSGAVAVWLSDDKSPGCVARGGCACGHAAVGAAVAPDGTAKLSGAKRGNFSVNGSSQPNVGFCAGIKSSNDSSGAAPPSLDEASPKDGARSVMGYSAEKSVPWALKRSITSR
jgi:hypothetical protein